MSDTVSWRLYALGGFLDSQTTDTQWEDKLSNPQYPDLYASTKSWVFADRITYWQHFLEHGGGISQLNYIEYQRRHAEALDSSSTGTTSESPIILPDSESESTSTPVDSLADKVLSIIELHLKGIEVDIRRQVEGKVDMEVEALRARIDLLCEGLHSERRWIRILELCLKENNITFPSYPHN